MRTSRHQGAGSSRINPTRLDNALDEIRALSTVETPFAAGCTLDGSPSDEFVEEAVSLARNCNVAVVFLGAPAEVESEACRDLRSRVYPGS